MSALRDALKGLEPETIAVYGNMHRDYWDRANMDAAIKHSMAVSAAKANANNSDLAEQVRRLIEEIQAIQTYGLRLNK